jgi:hypothetical protein
MVKACLRRNKQSTLEFILSILELTVDEMAIYLRKNIPHSGAKPSTGGLTVAQREDLLKVVHTIKRKITSVREDSILGSNHGGAIRQTEGHASAGKASVQNVRRNSSGSDELEPEASGLASPEVLEVIDAVDEMLTKIMNNR